MKNRNERIDIMKGIGIVMMVAGHSGIPCTSFIFLFHMSFFFMASGYFFSDLTSLTFKEVLKSIIKKIKRLWIPFFIFNTFLVFTHNLFIKWNLYFDVSRFTLNEEESYFAIAEYHYLLEDILVQIANEFLFLSQESYNGASWFLATLFGIYLFYVLIDFLINRITKKYVLSFQTIISVIFLLIGYYFLFKNNFLWYLPNIFSFYSLFHFGRLLAKLDYREENPKKNFLIFVISFTALVLLDGCGHIELDANFYETPMFLFVTSTYGWFFLYSMSFFIYRCDFLKRLFSDIGKRTLSILLLHFLCMKIVVVMIVALYSYPKIYLAFFPHLNGGIGFWWVAYTFVGVVIPSLIDYYYHYIIKKFVHSANNYQQCN